ncbi:hypothetical protein DMN91_000092 [Ooceraea biroi]|uniref:RNA-directed DNA polymerase n=1 Tax=Ooceraea biroi TaxID=2015173 RepID=A0A3L8E2T2_OOCBI|nr:hypothetical protein DMN91_000092 [Ooceraea biroi]
MRMDSQGDHVKRRPVVIAKKRRTEKGTTKPSTLVALYLQRIVDLSGERANCGTRLFPFSCKLGRVDQRPSWREIAPYEVAAKIYWSHWDTLIVENGILYKTWVSTQPKSNRRQIIVPRDRIAEVLREAHDSPAGGHFGINKTLAKIRQRYYWATCKSNVEDWCASCQVCVAKKGPSSKGKSPLQVYNVGCPFERLQVDILGPLPATAAGNKYLLVAVDCFTKWPEAVPLRSKRAITVAEALVGQVFSRHGIPLELHTDQGRNFESRLFKEMSALLGMRKTRTTPLHPQSDGQVERQHQIILNYLAKFVAENQRDWDRWVPMFLLAFRSSRQEATGITPAEMYRGYDLRLPLDLLRGHPPMESGNNENFVQDLQRKLGEIHHSARDRLRISSKNMKAWYDRRARDVFFEPGQKVWFYNPRRIKGRAPKLQTSWEGPYEVTRRISEVVYEIRKSVRHRRKIIHANRLAHFRERRVS